MHITSLHTLDNHLYMDTDATSHTATSQGNLSSYLTLSNLNQKFIFGNGHGIPIYDTQHIQIRTSHKPLHLNHVLSCVAHLLTMAEALKQQNESLQGFI